MNVIPAAAAEYARHKAWREAGGEPNKCPSPTATDVLDAELDRLCITDRAARDKVYTIWAQQVVDLVEPERTEPTQHRSNIRHSPVETIDVNDLPYYGRFSHSRGD